MQIQFGFCLPVSMKVDLDRIRTEAVSLANRHGLESLSIGELAAALGIRPPSLYTHVDGLGAVRRLLALHGLRELEQGVARLTAGKSGPDAIRALLNGYRQFARNNPGVYSAMLATTDREDPERRESVERLVQTLTASLHDYAFEGPQQVHVFRCLRSLVHGFVSLEANGALNNPVSRDESFEWMVEAFLRMLAPYARRAPAARSPGGAA
ncbi:TetR family transcriptional regulator [Burkholderia gladioli]|uniref:TetR family transcriptional regulator n=3 Tax=Burkholderiaceae TaxID=119060 RepID=A0A2A7SBL8_BURGA|nr:TetR family transcriptional regulator [Burkholderia gladioli]PEH81052.1 TetR family transcriptional regulator [Burkholderia gladioli]